MERKQFLKSLGMTALLLPLLSACSKANDPVASTTNTNGTSGTSSGTTTGTCIVTNDETAGPFPTKSPSGLVMTDIRSDRTGVPLTVTITIQDKNNSCAALKGAMVDIWHCDKDGYYSEYGGSGMQAVNFQSVHFLRGRQTTNENGQVGFTSIFPGWYSGRATHIHVHVYNAAGTSLLITQIAFPEGAASGVTLVNASSANGYTKGMNGYTSNASDNVFSDGVTNELATVAGSVEAGYLLTHTVVVNA